MTMSRLAKVDDYIEVDGYYKLEWCDYLCPGNPAVSPESGVAEYNTYVIEKLNAQEKKTIKQTFQESISWIISSPVSDIINYGKDIVSAYEGDLIFHLLVAKKGYSDKEYNYRNAASFFNDSITELISKEQLNAIKVKIKWCSNE